MKTDLSKILTVKGQGGLFTYIARSKSGAIAESIRDGKRTNLAATSGITTLYDISIYTSEGEVKLQEVFERMHKALGEEAAPSPKASSEQLVSFFEKALPDYDRDRFYVSHMKKVTDWYNQLREFASLDFTDPEAEAEAPEEA